MTPITVAGKDLYRDQIPHVEGISAPIIEFCALKGFTAEEKENLLSAYPFNSTCDKVHVIGKSGFVLTYVALAKDESMTNETLQLFDAISKTLTFTQR